MARLLIVVSMTLILGGCLFAPATYVKASAPNAEQHSSTCAGSGPGKDVAVLSGPENIMISVTPPYTLDDGDIAIRLEIYVPPTAPVSVRFASGTFLLVDAVTNAVLEYGATHVWDARGTSRRLDIREPLSGGPRLTGRHHTRRWFGTTIDYRPYVVTPSFKGVRSKHVRLRIPPLEVGTQTFEFPEVDIREVREWIVATLNC